MTWTSYFVFITLTRSHSFDVKREVVLSDFVMHKIT